MFTNYIFNMYGTLVDLQFDETNNELWRQLALFFSYNKARYFSSELKTAYFREVEQIIWQNKLTDFPDVDVRNAFFRLYRNKGITPSDELVIHTARLFRSLSTQDIGLYDNAEELLKFLKSKNNKLFILSNGQRAFSIPELEYLGIDQYFDGMYFSSDIFVSKPDQKIFTHLFKQEKLDPSACVMIGNDISADIMGANLVGMKAVFFNSNHYEDSAEDPGTDLIINDRDLLRVKKLTGL